MLGSAIQSFNDCIYVELPSWSHWWQTFMIAWRWNPWSNSAMRLIFWDTLVDSTWYKAEILLKTGEDQWSMRPHVPKGMKRQSSTLAPVIRKAFISHHLLVKNIYCEISQNQEDDLAKNLVPTPHRMNTKDFDHPLTVNVAPSSGQSFKLSTIYSNTGFYTNAHNRKDGHLITAGAAPLFVFIWLTYIKKHTFKKCVQQVSEERAAFTLVPEERHVHVTRL